MFSYADESTTIPEFPTSNQSKIVLEENPDLKSDLFSYLFYDSCFDMKKRIDYKNLYNFLSEEYLSKVFPNVKSAEEYEIRMENSEVYHNDYLMIENIEYLKSDEVKIKLLVEEGWEGVLYKVEEIIFFKKENGVWKYTKSDPERKHTKSNPEPSEISETNSP